MSDLVMDGPVTLEQGLKIVDGEYVQGVIRYLKTKEPISNHQGYTSATRKFPRYSYPFDRMVLKLCDELDKAADLNVYFKDTLTKHIEKIVLPDLKKKKEEVLLKDYVKEWKDYTILVHFMRKMFNYLVSIFLPLLLDRTGTI